MNSITLAFDVYGTLIDTAGVTSLLKQYVGDNAKAFSTIWRDKQLEYSFRRGLMQNYCDFATCTKHALEYTDKRFNANLSEQDKAKLMAEYHHLPAFPDVKAGLEMLQSAGFRLFAFSNGCADDVQKLLKNASIANYFRDIISVDEIKTFKPNPAVYSHFIRRSGALGSETWLISSNPFDVIGAISAGIRGAWICRTPEAIFDPWEIEPTVTVGGLTELKQVISL
jgi:2-haloacid dehalogenase